MSESEFLTPGELHQLTGFARAPGQVSWLVENRVPHRAVAGRVIASRALVRDWISGKQVVISKGPNWSSVK